MKHGRTYINACSYTYIYIHSYIHGIHCVCGHVSLYSSFSLFEKGVPTNFITRI